MENANNHSATRNGFVGLLFSRKAGRIVSIAFLLFLIYAFGFRGVKFFLVPSQSMLPTLHIGDQLVTLRSSTYKRGDIVVIRDLQDSEFLVKRIAGVAGDVITVEDGGLFVNGAYASEPYIMEPMQYFIGDPIIVPQDHVFVLGDNRNESDDGHVGRTTVVAAEKIVGRVRYIYFPYDRMGLVRSYPLVNSIGQ
jgi:signal peptidase I